MKTLILLLLALLLAGSTNLPSPAAEPATPTIAITRENGQWRVTGPTMDALIGPDGCLSVLRFPFPGESWVHVPNVLKPGIGLPVEAGAGGSRGAFFYQHGEILRLTDIQQHGDHSLIAQSERAAIRYDFSITEQRWTVTNKTDAPMQFLLVLDPTVHAVRSAQGDYRKTPVIELWDTATWFQGKRRVQISGASRLWGPGTIIGQDWKQGHFQVWEATLAPREARQIVLTHGIASADEVATLTGIAPEVPFRGTAPTQMQAPVPVVDGALTVLAPRDYQVFQRRTKLHGAVAVAGQVTVACDAVEARLRGNALTGALPEAWQALPLEKVRRTFAASLPTPAGGWYTLELRALRAGVPVAQAVVPHVGVGEVFVGCGQSNSTNCGDTRLNTETGMVATFNGTEWRLAHDPQPGTFDNSDRGSLWPAFGDALFRKYGVPIGVAATGQGGAPVGAWRAGSPAFIWLMTRILQLGPGGFRALLWHQGESNVRQDSAYYFTNLSQTITASHAVAGWAFPWFVAQTSYNNPREPAFPAVRDGQRQLWERGYALEGPDTDTLTGDNRAGIHFSARGLLVHGALWAEKVGVYLDQVLAE